MKKANTTNSGAYPTRENIEQVIHILSQNAYSKEECEEVNWDDNKIEDILNR